MPVGTSVSFSVRVLRLESHLCSSVTRAMGGSQGWLRPCHLARLETLTSALADLLQAFGRWMREPVCLCFYGYFEPKEKGEKKMSLIIPEYNHLPLSQKQVATLF